MYLNIYNTIHARKSKDFQNSYKVLIIFVIPTLTGLRHEDGKFDASQRYIERSRFTQQWSIKNDLKNDKWLRICNLEVWKIFLFNTVELFIYLYCWKFDLSFGTFKCLITIIHLILTYRKIYSKFKAFENVFLLYTYSHFLWSVLPV